MKTVFIGSYKTIEEHCTVISQELSVLGTSNFVNEFTPKSVYILYLYTLLSQLV